MAALRITQAGRHSVSPSNGGLEPQIMATNSLSVKSWLGIFIGGIAIVLAVALVGLFAAALQGRNNQYQEDMNNAHDKRDKNRKRRENYSRRSDSSRNRNRSKVSSRMYQHNHTATRSKGRRRQPYARAESRNGQNLLDNHAKSLPSQTANDHTNCGRPAELVPSYRDLNQNVAVPDQPQGDRAASPLDVRGEQPAGNHGHPDDEQYFGDVAGHLFFEHHQREADQGRWRDTMPVDQ
jgi:hypothetical protein